MKFHRPIPVLRSFDEANAREFYVDFLGFKVDWEHRFDDTLPLYMQISRSDCILHISEHFGDASPGVAMRIEVEDAAAYQKHLLAQQYKHARPGLEETPWGAQEVRLTDPFGNRLTFYTEIEAKE
jgi:uncharacterized glyoxalase superfamily protein PhnB